MTWVLYIWIGYMGNHSTMTMHGEFKTEQKCQEVGNALAKPSYTITRFYCVPKEK